MRITIFGTGYVGLVHAAVLAGAGNDVLCVDTNQARVDQLSDGQVPIYEPMLEPLVRDMVEAGRLRFTTRIEAAVAHAPLQFIAVGTPPQDDGSTDLTHVCAVADAIGMAMEEDMVVVVKSTVPVGTCDVLRARIAATLASRCRADLTFDICSNPEFLREGSAVSDCAKPDRVILGVESKATEALLRTLYTPYVDQPERIVVMDCRSAELTKYAANCMLATKISFINEIAAIAGKLGADILHVQRGLGSDPRIGRHFINAGIGYGGSCLPKDVDSLIWSARQVGLEPDILGAVAARNRLQRENMIELIERHFGGDLRGRMFAVWGLAFKPETDDMRAAPSRSILEGLWARGAFVRAFDPKAMNECSRIYGERPDLVLCNTRDQALDGADALIVLTEWDLFTNPDLSTLKSSLSQPVVFDGRNIYDPGQFATQGVKVYGIGRGSVPSVPPDPET